MNENEFEYNGRKFKTTEIELCNFSCEGCSFSKTHCFNLAGKKLIPGCMGFERKDKKDVIFVEVE